MLHCCNGRGESHVDCVLCLRLACSLRNTRIFWRWENGLPGVAMGWGLTRLAAVAIVAFTPSVLSAEAAASQVIPRPRPNVAVRSVAEIDHGTVYLFRGLANIFSLGMNTLADELNERGVATLVRNHSHALRLADQLAKKYKTDPSVPPIIIIGHSLGANAALTMSARLAEKDVPVRLVVLFDATVPHRVPPNVEEVLNLHKPSRVGVAVAGAPGFKGTIDNKDVSDIPGVGHISIDKSKKLHAEVVEKVLGVIAEKRLRKKK